ncbi:MAG: DUF4337 domain-containing protein [Verrucomicrobiota bacterium]
MEEQEVPIEQVQKHIEHHAHLSQEKWISAVALTTALLAALAALASLLSGEHANEGMLSQIKASNQWSYFQAKGIKSSLLGSKTELLEALGHPVAPVDAEKLAGYSREQKEIKEAAEQNEKEAEIHMHTHIIFARGVTFFQIAISVAAISILTKRRMFWAVSLVFGGIGIFSLLHGFLSGH